MLEFLLIIIPICLIVGITGGIHLHNQRVQEETLRRESYFKAIFHKYGNIPSLGSIFHNFLFFIDIDERKFRYFDVDNFYDHIISFDEIYLVEIKINSTCVWDSTSGKPLTLEDISPKRNEGIKLWYDESVKTIEVVVTSYKLNEDDIPTQYRIRCFNAEREYCDDHPGVTRIKSNMGRRLEAALKESINIVTTIDNCMGKYSDDDDDSRDDKGPNNPLKPLYRIEQFLELGKN